MSMAIKLSELAGLVFGANIITTNEHTEDLLIHNLQVDSRLVTEGDLFICLPGATVDGHDFAAQAVAQGAIAIVVQRRLDLPVPQLLVKDVRYALAVIACHFFDYPSQKLKVIGVTGTNGKTTITYLLDRILQDAGFRTGVMGTIGIRIGDEWIEAKNTTQDILELQRSFAKMVEQNTDYALIEVSSHALDMGRVRGVQFRSGIFTNLTQDHLDYHHTMENYHAAKRLLFSRMSNGFTESPSKRQFVILNADDAASPDYAASTAAHVVSYGIDQAADLQARDIRITAQGTTFRCETVIGICEMQLKMIGKFSVYNALAATATALAEGVSLEQIRDSLAKVSGVDGRFEPVDEGQSYTVIVDYAHTPDSLENVLLTVREFVRGRVICVFGCGGNRDRGKRPQMAAIAAQYSDVVIATSDNPRFEEPIDILRDVEAGFQKSDTNYQLIVDRKEAIDHAIAMATADDVILIAGKGHETYQEIRGIRYPSDDRVLAREAIRQRQAEENQR
jgi:UDP-N-acetylmuramoyl-L-alanyl-D-glutamate--2,6-diaminopimelate ligase